MNLVEGLLAEIDRVNEIMDIYADIPAGYLAKLSMEYDIHQAKTAIGSGDIQLIMASLEELKGYTL